MTLSLLGLSLSIIVWFSFQPSIAEAHRPSFPDGFNNSPYSAFELDDIDISQAVYQVLDENEQVWLKFQPGSSSSKTAIIQLGIPVLEETEFFRPMVAVISQDLKRIDLPFGLPDGFGAIAYKAKDEKPIRTFHEPYTETDSWILLEEEFDIIGTNIHYVVIFSETNQSGKFWFATGTKEVFDFSSSQLNKNILKVKTFHKPTMPSSVEISSQDKNLVQQSLLQGTDYIRSIEFFLVATLILSFLILILVKKKLR